MTMHSSSRNGAKVIWLGIHTTEGIMRAKALRDWTSWAGSSHAANDETGVLMTPRDGFVPYDRAAWTLRDGNPISENIEQCGWAHWTRAEWLARPKLLDTTALWLADRARARSIPLRLLTPDQIRRREPGVLGHGHYSTATGDGTHWDPGPNYPWDVVLAKAKWLLNPTPLETDPVAAPKEATVLQNYPLTGNGTVTLACPVGKASAVLKQAWFSAIGPGTVRVYEQTDTAGIREWTWPLTAAKGLAQRKVTPITDGATRLVVQYDFPDGGTLVLEGVPK